MSDQNEREKAHLLAFVDKLQEAAEDRADWWYQYWQARLSLRAIALSVIASPKRDTHPDRRSLDFKQVAQDITEDMKVILDPNHGCEPCPVCSNPKPPGNSPCIYCIAIKSGFTPKPLKPPETH